ncbi:putative ribosomal protein L21 [Candidatus Carsonella ruddii HT isolate Thao2000]|uniref:Putative ribosomal protein L21 n=1 Tax=Candidatus Carsonella ruddii HT isolate Thao2000 TaxID=1202539 RepID=J3TWD2_CARRU|nr:bL21 family ribosomal protein [Candidatus Carsonella ruddii]AFP84180.1 putative ribosomal protein L21 [Candidatus Carsonella ruddii HT isolate Thao2000]
MKKINLIFKINKKMYFCENNNYLITDYLNYNIGSKLIFKNIIYYYNNKIKMDIFGLNFNIYFIILKHFYIKTITIKKKRRKNVIKKNISYKKKSLIYIQNII